AALRAALGRGGWDAVISDYRMPGFTGMEALAITRQLAADVPFVLVSGTIGEELVVAAMKAGANDCVMKDDLARLAPALLRELREAATRAAQRDAQARLALLVDNVPAMIAYADAGGRFRYANLRYRRFYAGTDASIEGRSLADVLTPQAWERAKPGVERALAGEAVSYSGERVLHNGALRHVAVSLIPHRDEANAVRGLYVLALDVTAQHQAEAALRESEAGLRHAHEMAGLAHVVVRPDGSYEHWSSSWESLLGLPPGNAPRSTREALQFVHPEDRERFRLVAIEAARSGRRTAMEYRMQRPDGSVLHLRQTMEPFGDPDAQGRQRWFVTIQDVSEQKDREERLRFLAYYDPLTGLANRVLFLERLGERLSAARGTGACIGLAVVNIDRFKAVNDSYGRSTGDALLKEVAARLVRSTGRAERVARIGADQFAVVLPRLKGRDHVLRIAEEGLRVLEGTPCRVEGAELRLSTRSGIALFPDDGGDAETLFRNAEAAAKQAAGERLVFYTPRMTEQVAARLSLENKMHVALERGEFVLHYQPKVALDTQRITGGEALIRWQSPERGLVAPAEFIPVLEETGQIGAVGQWALRQAAADRAAWLAAGLPAPRIAVNVSPVQLRRADFVPQLSALIGETEAARGLDLEITESVVMQDIESNIAKLRAIRSLGAAIAVDDFGTGYSSLAYLARLPVAALKIDRSFIRAMLEDPDSMALVASIISLAHALRLAVVAEGVETDAQASHLRVMRCDEVQGFRFGRPVPEGDFRKLLAA
ncbi:MAG: EAL domain-containing protein, partial [Clostridia bacterium]